MAVTLSFQEKFNSFEKVVEFSTVGQNPHLMIDHTRLFYADQGAVEFLDPNRPWMIFFGFGEKPQAAPEETAPALALAAPEPSGDGMQQIEPDKEPITA